MNYIIIILLFSIYLYITRKVFNILMKGIGDRFIIVIVAATFLSMLWPIMAILSIISAITKYKS